MVVDKFPHTERNVRRTFCPLVPLRGGGADDARRQRLITEKVLCIRVLWMPTPLLREVSRTIWMPEFFAKITMTDMAK